MNDKQAFVDDDKVVVNKRSYWYVGARANGFKRGEVKVSSDPPEFGELQEPHPYEIRPQSPPPAGRFFFRFEDLLPYE